jgi:hypothetical protein
MGLWADAKRRMKSIKKDIQYGDVLDPEEDGKYGRKAKRDVKDYSVDEFWDAFQNAETGGIDDPWIRTTAKDTKGGSSAYGPVQLTRGLVAKYAKNNPKVIEDAGLSDFAMKFMDQGDEFLTHGNNKGKIDFYNPRYDYGGKGHLYGAQDQQDYSRLTKTLMGDLWEKSKKTDAPVENLIKYWRWGEEKAKDNDRNSDPRYFKEFYKQLRG